jgi:hypothetical protein
LVDFHEKVETNNGNLETGTEYILSTNMLGVLASDIRETKIYYEYKKKI